MKTVIRRILAFFFGALLVGIPLVNANELPIRGGQAPFSPLDPKRPSQLSGGVEPKPRTSAVPTTTPLIAPEAPMNWREKPVPAPSALPKHSLRGKTPRSFLAQELNCQGYGYPYCPFLTRLPLQGAHPVNNQTSTEPFQSKLMNKFSQVMGKVEDGTQTLRKQGLERLSSVMHDFANRLTELNKNLDLNAPIREKALESSKKRELRAAAFGSTKRDRASEQNPKAPEKSGAV